MVDSPGEEKGCWAHSSMPSHFVSAALRGFLPTGHLRLDWKAWSHTVDTKRSQTILIGNLSLGQVGF